MKPLFKNVTIYNSKNYNQFIKFHEKKFSFSYNAYNLAMTILLIYCIVSTIIQKNIALMFVFLFMLAFIVLFRIYLPMKKYQKTQKKYKNNKQTSYTISFYKFYFSVDENTFSYFRLYKVFETKDYFYLYVDEENAVLVSKNGFKLGTLEDFTNFIKKKCLFKYSKQM